MKAFRRGYMQGYKAILTFPYSNAILVGNSSKFYTTTKIPVAKPIYVAGSLFAKRSALHSVVNNLPCLSLENTLLVSQNELLAMGAAEKSLVQNKEGGLYTPFTKTMVIRGIGYRFFYVFNDFGLAQEDRASSNFSDLERVFYSKDLPLEHFGDSDEDVGYWSNYLNDFVHARYLIVRAGHTTDLYFPLSPNVYVRTGKKDRKMVLYGPDKQQVNNLARTIFNYRPPSVYTGRGIRRKHLKPIRKAGKRDRQRGRVF